MLSLKASQIRRKWLDYFVAKGHVELPSKSLVPVNDPSLLWVNSGVATLKDYFSGKETPPSRRLTNSQRAIRTNDIENVGQTARHHTFFEMLGNFSIGDYFKTEAVAMAHELLTDVFGIPLDRLYFTVYDQDEDARKAWEAVGVPADRIIPGGRETNFWDIGAGPCGPCTEIFYDRGARYDPKGIGLDLLRQNVENDRYVEVWNIVFSQFSNDGEGNLTELAQKNIDTGAGLERLASVMQNAPTNFDTDLFKPLIDAIGRLADKPYDPAAYFSSDPQAHATNAAYKVIADHMRAVVFAVADGAVPSNKERGYIVRRLIRRAAVYARRLSIKGPLLVALVDAVVVAMGDYYPYLSANAERVREIVGFEEERFAETLEEGLAILEKLTGEAKEISAENAFRMFDTYGFPIELTVEVASQKKIPVDLEGFKRLFAKHQDRSRSTKTATGLQQQNPALLALKAPSEFVYGTKELTTTVVAIFNEDLEQVQSANGQPAWLVLAKTPLYATSGGQIADRGKIDAQTVTDVVKAPNGQHLHKVEGGSFALGQTVQASVAWDARMAAARHHTAEHVLHTVLKKTIDEAIKQEGSSKTPERLTFDFYYHQRLTPAQIQAVEDAVNKVIADKLPIEVVVTDLDTAQKMGALAYFADVYEKIGKDKLRVVNVKGLAAELCGGTHLNNTAEIERFKIVGIEAKGAGSWRLECLASERLIAEHYASAYAALAERLASLAEKVPKMPDPLLGERLKDANRLVADGAEAGLAAAQKATESLIKDVAVAEAKIAADMKKGQSDELASKAAASLKEGVSVIVTAGVDPKVLVAALALAKDAGDGRFYAVNVFDGQTRYFAAVSPNQVKAGKRADEAIRRLNEKLDGRGGGKQDTAQGGTAGDRAEEAVALLRQIG